MFDGYTLTIAVFSEAVPEITGVASLEVTPALGDDIDHRVGAVGAVESSMYVT